jgi:AbrB family looped-hinge helix DNA binding protein
MSRMTSKGQVTIPKKIRDYLGLKPGSEVEFTVGNNGQIVIRQRDGQSPTEQRKRFVRALEQLRGSAGPGMSTDEVMRLTRGWGEPDYDVK